MFDLSSNASVWGLSQITGIRLDPINVNNAIVEIDYMGFSNKSE